MKKKKNRAQETRFQTFYWLDKGRILSSAVLD